MISGLLGFVGFVCLVFGLLLVSKLRNKRYAHFLIAVAAVTVTISVFPSEPIVYKLGEKEYIAKDGDVIKSADKEKIFVWKPDGVVRSYATVYDTLAWLPPGRILPGGKVILKTKGSPRLSEQIRLLRDSVSPLDTFRAKLKKRPNFNQLRSLIMRYHPVVRPANITFITPR